jgi:hypothetical protein
MNKFKLATWNVTTLSMPQDKGEEGYYGKLDIFESQFRDQGYDIVALQETHVPGKRLDPISGHTYDTYLSGTDVNTAGVGQRRAGVGLCIHRSLAKYTQEWHPVNERIGWLSGTWLGFPMVIIVVYAPTQAQEDEGGNEDGISEEKHAFYAALEKVVTSLPNHLKYKCCVLGDFNARVGKSSDEDNE